MKFKSIKKPLIWLVVLGVPGGLCWLTYFYYTIDEDPPADGHLRPARPAVAFEENGYHLLDFRAEQVYWPEENHYEAKGMAFTGGWDGQIAADLLEKNRELLEKFDRSMERTHFQVPEITSFNRKISELNALREIAEMARVRIYSLLLAGSDREAIAEAVKLIRFGHRIEGSGGALVHYLVGCAVKLIGIDCLTRITPRTRLGSSELFPYVQDLSNYYPSREGLIEALKVEYRVLADTIDRIARGDADVRAEVLGILGHPLQFAPRSLALGLFNPNKTKRMFAEAYPLIFEAIGKRKIEAPDLEGLGTVGLPRDSWVPYKNTAGRMLFQMLIATEASSVITLRWEELLVSKTRLLMALLCYQRGHGRLPATLNDLVPEYLKEVPRDPYDGRPLRYSAEKKLIWAVGKDLQDAGGAPPKAGDEARPDPNEPTFRIEF